MAWSDEIPVKSHGMWRRRWQRQDQLSVRSHPTFFSNCKSKTKDILDQMASCK